MSLNHKIETEEWEDMNKTEEIEYEIENLQNKLAELEKKKQIEKEKIKKIKETSFEYNFQLMNGIITKNIKYHRKLKLEFIKRRREIERQRGFSTSENPKENDYEITHISLQQNNPEDNYLFTEALFNMLKSFNERLEKLENI